jgi:2-hydroxychromene-2-carboxylate isomerase
MQIQFVLDYRSPYAYLANTQAPALGAQITYEPVDIVGVMKAVNNQPSPTCPPKSRYAALDAARWAKLYGVPFFPNRTLLAALSDGSCASDLLSRAAIASQLLGVFEPTNDALFEAVWAGSDDLVSAAGRSQFAVSHELPGELWEMTETTEVKAKLAANGERAVTRGVFGVPTFFVDDEMFFGNDRLGFIGDRLKEASPRTLVSSKGRGR